MKLFLKTLTPLHVGSGENFRVADYVVSGDTCYKISTNFAIQFAKQNGLLREFSEWSSYIAEKFAELELLRKNNRGNKNKKADLNRERVSLYKNSNPHQFFKEKRLEEPFVKKLKEHDKTIQMKLYNTQQLPETEIREQIKNALGHAYIPGTTIKGAIRTALLFYWLKNNKSSRQKIYEILSNELKSVKKKLGGDKKSEYIKKGFAQKIEQEAFYCGIGKADQKVSFEDEKFDLMKFLRVTDAVAVKKTVPFRLVKSNLFLTNGTVQKQSNWLEVIDFQQIFECNIDFDMQFFLNIKPLLKENSLTYKNQKIWIDIDKKCKDLFAFSIHDLNQDNLSQTKEKVILHILKAVNDFSNAQIHSYNQWKSKIPNNPKNNDKKTYFDKEKLHFPSIDSGHKINLGFATGFTGTTEFLYFLGDDYFHQIFEEVMEFFEIGYKRNDKNPNNKPNIKNFPKSRTLVEIQDKIIPLGWLEILNTLPTEKETQQALNETNTPITETQAFQPQYYTGKIEKIKNQKIHGICVGTDPKNPKIKKIKLLVGEVGNEPIVDMQYGSDLPNDRYLIVEVSNVQKNIITSIKFIKFAH